MRGAFLPRLTPHRKINGLSVATAPLTNDFSSSTGALGRAPVLRTLKGEGGMSNVFRNSACPGAGTGARPGSRQRRGDVGMSTSPSFCLSARRDGDDEGRAHGSHSGKCRGWPLSSLGEISGPEIAFTGLVAGGEANQKSASFRPPRWRFRAVDHPATPFFGSATAWPVAPRFWPSLRVTRSPAR